MYVFFLSVIHSLKTRRLGRFVPIFYFNCEHFLFIYIAKQKRKKFCGFKKMVDFKNLMKFEFCWMQIFENSIIHKPSLGFHEVPQKMWGLGPIGSAGLTFIGYKRTDRQTITPRQVYI